MTDIIISKDLVLKPWEPIKRYDSVGYLVYADWKKIVKNSADECFIIFKVSNEGGGNVFWRLEVTGNKNYEVLKRIHNLFLNDKSYKETYHEESPLALRNAFDKFLTRVSRLLIFS
jgi:hypothetical protein